MSIISFRHKGDFAKVDKYFGKLKNVLATYAEAEDLINIGAYKQGSNKNIDYAISKIEAVNEFLRQRTDEKFMFDEEVQLLEQLFEG